jgi:hypothetical protein
MDNNDNINKYFAIDYFNQIIDQLTVKVGENGKRKYNIDKSNNGNLILLLGWPGVFAENFSSRIENYEIFEQENDYEYIGRLLRLNYLSSFNEKNSLAKKMNIEMTKYIKSIVMNTLLLTHPKSIHYDQNNANTLTYLFLQYLTTVLVIINAYENDKFTDKIFYSHDDLVKNILRHRTGYLLIDCFLLISCWWVTQSFDYFKSHFRKYFNAFEINNYDYKDSTYIQHKKLQLHRVINKKGESIGICHEINFEELNDEDNYGIAIDINSNKYLKENFSIYILGHRDPKTNQFDLINGCLFYKRYDIFFDPLEDLFNYLIMLNDRIINIAKDMYFSLNNFIDSPEKVIGSNLKNWKFKKFIGDIASNYNFLNAMSGFKEFERAFLSADKGLDANLDEYYDVRRDYIKAQHNKIHIPEEIKKKLLEANQELDFISNKVKNKVELLDEGFNIDDDGILEFFKKHKIENEYLEIIDDTLIFGFDFFSKNSKRNFSRKLLPIIKNHLEGKPSAKTMAGSVLRKRLGIKNP